MFAVCVFKRPPAGLEPAIYRLEVCRLIHWATEAVERFLRHLEAAGLDLTLLMRSRV